MPVSFEEKGDHTRVDKELRRVSQKRVLVGIPAKNDPRPGEPIGNAMLAYIHNLGSPLQGIPPRPHIVPGIQNVRTQIEGQLKEALQAAFEGQSSSMIDKHLHNAGQIAVNSIRGLIQAGLKPPLKQATVDRRRQRSKGSKYRRVASTASQTTPLWDTGNYVRHITYVIRNKGDTK